MTAPSVVSTITGETQPGGSATNHVIPYPSGSGGLVVAFVGFDDSGSVTITSWPGWTQLSVGYYGVVDGRSQIWYTESPGAGGTNVTVTTSAGADIGYNLYRISGYGDIPVDAGWVNNAAGIGTVHDPPSLVTGYGSVDTLFIAALVYGNGSRTVSVFPSGYSSGIDWSPGISNRAGVASARKAATATGDDPGTFTLTSTSWGSLNTIGIRGLATPTAEFSWDETAARTLQFTDESTNTPSSWAWDFGDGGTSTAQNPTHVYAAAGTYTVTLTVTNAVGSDAVSHDIGVIDAPPYEPPEAGLAILEIYVSDPASPRWDLANWDEANWGASGWVDVTPQGISVRIQWGSTRPELGILSMPDAANWYVIFYDPNRILDPANQASPYFTDLRPGLPIRIRHRGIVVKTGQADVIGHSMLTDQGLIRGSDIISLMARADVPEDVMLSDTLIARARDAIAAAGLDITVSTSGMVATEHGGGGIVSDPALGAQMDGQHTVWDIIRDAAQAVLWQPYVTRTNALAFRRYFEPFGFGPVIGSPNLVDLQSIVDTAGLVSEVNVQQTVADGGVLINRAITPPPWFGKRIVNRAEETPDADDWADQVLGDRSVSGIRWVPGDVVPFTADEVEYFAKIDPVSRVTLRMTEALPEIEVEAVLLGGTITAIGKQDDSARWRFTFEAATSVATTGLSPLTLDGGSATDYLTTESGSDYLYAG